MSTRETSVCPSGNDVRLQSADSTAAAERLQFEAWAAESPAARARAVRRLIARALALQSRGLRALHPTASEREIFLRAAALRLGADAVRRWTGFDADSGRG